MKRVAAAAERNKTPILDTLRSVLPRSGLVLEVASGTGQHALYFAEELPSLTWQPTDADESALSSIAEYVHDAAMPNLLPPLALRADADEWPVARADAVLCINMIHIAPFGACLGLLRGARRCLASGSPLVLYGPFQIDGNWGADSNAAFDARLRSEDPAWGVRELRDIEQRARELGFELDAVIPRPANNHVVVFR
jgi:SAM-dependent methyltransferase